MIEPIAILKDGHAVRAPWRARAHGVGVTLTVVSHVVARLSLLNKKLNGILQLVFMGTLYPRKDEIQYLSFLALIHACSCGAKPNAVGGPLAREVDPMRVQRSHLDVRRNSTSTSPGKNHGWS